MKTEFDASRPIYLQLAEQLAGEITSGKRKQGDRLPSVRELAAETMVNPNTAARALAELERTGLAETRRGSGKFVTCSAEDREKRKWEEATDKTKAWIGEMKALGLDQAEIRKLMEENL